jgi:beta-glucosidase
MAAFSHVEAADMSPEIDPNASPIGSTDTNTTPGTEFSPPESPFQQFPPLKSPRLLARSKLSALTQEEKVRSSLLD